MADVRTIWKQLGFDFLKHRLGRAGLLRERFIEQLINHPRLRVRKDSFLFDAFEVSGKQVNDLMSAVAKFLGVHSSPPTIL
jgi:hypothetical protein